MDPFDHVPAHPEISGNPTDGPEVKKIENGQGERAHIPVFPYHEWKSRPPEVAAVHTFEAMKIEDQEALLAPDRAHEEPSGLLPLVGGFPATASGTSDECIGHLCPEDDGVRPVVSRCVANTFQAKGVVKYRRGHGFEPPSVVRLASNNRVLAMSISCFATPRYSFAG